MRFPLSGSGACGRERCHSGDGNGAISECKSRPFGGLFVCPLLNLLTSIGHRLWHFYPAPPESPLHELENAKSLRRIDAMKMRTRKIVRR